jgi:hypothetical protein
VYAYIGTQGVKELTAKWYGKSRLFPWLGCMTKVTSCDFVFKFFKKLVDS